MRTRILAAAVAVALLSGCSSSPAQPAPSKCPMVGANGCETASPGVNTGTVDRHTQSACDAIHGLAHGDPTVDLTNVPLQVAVLDDAAASPNIDVRTAGTALGVAWRATETDHGTAARLALGTAAVKLETACLHAGWKPPA